MPLTRLSTHLLGTFILIAACFPVTLALPKLVLLLLAASTAAIGALYSSKLTYSREARLYGPVVFAVLGIGALVGGLSGQPGWDQMSRVWFVWPALFLVCAPALNSERQLTIIGRYLLVALLAVSTLTLAFGLGLIDVAGSIFGNSQRVEGVGLVRLRFTTALSMNFLLAFGAALATEGSASSRRSSVAMIASTLGVAAAFFAGQRSILLAAAIGIAIGLRSSGRLHGASLLRFVFVGVVAALGLRLVGVDVALAFEGLTSIDPDADGVRTEQAAILFDEWLASPIYGHGWGHVVPNYTRSISSPWSYELTPFVFLMSLGLAGPFIVLLSLISVGRSLRRAHDDLDSIYARPIFAGFLAAVVSATFNPSVSTLGSIWMIFVPVLLANMVQNQRSAKKRENRPTPTSDARSKISGAVTGLPEPGRH